MRVLGDKGPNPPQGAQQVCADHEGIIEGMMILCYLGHIFLLHIVL